MATSDQAVAEVGATTFELRAGDSLIVPAFTDFSLANPSKENFEAVVVLPIGGRVIMADGTLFIPPWCA